MRFCFLPAIGLAMSHRHTGFTIVELLVVIGLTALLIAMLMAALANARLTADRMTCLSNMKQLETAHWAYIADNNGAMLGASVSGANASWVEALTAYDDRLVMRSPVDSSPHFGEGTPVNGRFRLTSYAINYNLLPENPSGFGMIDEVASPSEAVHLVIKVFEGPGAVMDHVNPNAWHAPGLQVAMANAAREIQVNAHGGDEGSLVARSAYGFLDGHAEQLTFEEVYGTDGDNGFKPKGRGQGNANGNGSGNGPPVTPPGLN